MSTIKLSGILTNVFPATTTPNFAKKCFWLKEPDTERYPNQWEIELHTADIARIDEFSIGDRLECEVEVRGKNWRGERIFISLKCVGIRLLEKLELAPGKKFTPKEKPGRAPEKDQDRPQLDLPL